MKDIRNLVRIQLGVVLLFIVMKGIRSSVLQSTSPNFLKVFLLSFPNFCEAIVGVLTLTGVGLYVNNKLVKPAKRIKEKTIYGVATVMTAIYVILQEFKFHNLGGTNVYDPMDVVFSVAGLMVGFGAMLYLKPAVAEE